MTNPVYSVRPVAIWLFCCCILVFMMTGIGAITRLTESGLSITEWKVVSGALPPLNEQAWQESFEKYKASPEYKLKHFWMSIEDYKQIFFWEWLHRLWGRLIGLAFAVPLIFFWVTKRIPPAIKPNLLILLALGAAQGYMGWYMVKSGLVDEPSVSHYRLAAHLSLALLVYSYMLWTGLKVWASDPVVIYPHAAPTRSLYTHGWIALACVAVTIVWGAFVAGLDAGLIYNEFPKMGDGLMPPEMWAQSPAIMNLVENHASVQFMHRWIAIATGLVVLAYAWRGTKKTDRPVFALLAAWVFVQIGMGIGTLLSQVWIPVAVMHQLGAVILLTFVIASLQAANPARAKISE